MIPGSIQASTTGDSILDQRFAELLKPIKDLTQNWEVPLSELLSGYIDDLQHLTITLDGGQTSINFAQAALVLQGTASVYSKKIEFLWKLVGDMLDTISNKKASEDGAQGEESGGGGGSKGRKRQIDMTREFQYLTTDIGRNLDIKTDEEERESIKERKDKLNFIYITPRQLIEKEGSEQKSVKVNMYTGVAHSKWDLLAAKEDFRINSQYVTLTGYLGEDLNVDNLYLNLVQEDTVGGDHTGVPVQTEEVQDDLEDIPESAEEVTDLGPPDSGPGLDDSVMSERAAGQNISSGERELVMSPPPPPPPVTTGPWTPEPVVDLWTPLDPHQEMTTPKPMKVKATRKLPPSMRKKRQAECPISPISEYLNQQMNPTANQLKKWMPCLPPALYDHVLQEQDRRKSLEREERKRRAERRDEGVRRQIFGNLDEEEEVVHGGDGRHDDHEDDDIGDNFDDFQLPDPHLGGDVGALAVGQVDAEDNFNGVGNESLSYEELVARKVEEFVTKSQEYMRSSELSQKVAKWHEMIGPRLESLEKRKPFDIHAYGSQVIDKCENTREPEVHFNHIVSGQKKEEISRFFLSTLMLANTGNVQISTSGCDQSLGMDNVQLKLLSTNRHHQRLEDFQALRQTGENDGDLSQASLSRGEKRNASPRTSVSPQKKKSPKKKKTRLI